MKDLVNWIEVDDNVPLPQSFEWYLHKNTNALWCEWRNAFSDNEIDQIKNIREEIYFFDGKVSSENREDKNIRNSKIGFIPTNEKNSWLFSKLSGLVINVNQQCFNYDLQKIQTLQYTTYSTNEFYEKHIDMEEEFCGSIRKLSFVMSLTNPNEYEGGELSLYNSSSPVNFKLSKGSILFFSSFVLHEVKPITKGFRETIVGWVSGPKFI